MSTYNKTFCQQLHSYRKLRFAEYPELFDRQPDDTVSRPPVFLPDSADHNVLTDPKASRSEQQQLLSLMAKRHIWFGSMKSSQAMAQSLFGNLFVSGKLDVLSTIRTDDDAMMFGRDGQAVLKCKLEHTVNRNPLKEKALTEIDVFFPGEYQVAVECKLTETAVGACAIPKRKNDECDGDIHDRPGSPGRCYLTNRGIKYWDYVPELFDWKYESDRSPCPLQLPYQLVRNILSVCICQDGTIDPDKGHVVLVFDDRNPAFQTGGIGDKAWQACRTALKFPRLLQKCSWQVIVRCLRNDSTLGWLTDEIDSKYGIR
jgi:hypothetical protein